jgi:hypothetical protein
MATTERANYAFIVKEHGDGTPWIVCELRRGTGLNILNHGLLGFELPPGTDLQKAHSIARFLNDNLGDLSHTRLP